MSEETLFEKLGVKYIEKEGIFYPLITLGGEKNSTDVGKNSGAIKYVYADLFPVYSINCLFLFISK